MAKVAEGMARVASEIAASRRERSKLATEIKVTTQHRRSDVGSFLKGVEAARGTMSRKQAEDGRSLVKARHAGVFSLLVSLQRARGAAASARAAEGKRMTAELRSVTRSKLSGLETTRLRETRDAHKEAVATTKVRQVEVKAMLDGFARDDVARSRRREELAEEQREKSAAFKKELTNSVDAFRDKLAKEGRDRAVEIRDSLASSADDRRQGTAIWTGGFSKKQPVQERSAQAPRGATAGPAHDAPRVSEPAPVMEHSAPFVAVAPQAHQDKVKTAQPSPNRQAARNQHGRQGGQSK